MMHCPDCNIDVGGQIDTCPLCGASLTGEGTPSYWPAPEALKKKYYIFRIQCIAVVVLCVLMFIVEFGYKLGFDYFWAPPTALWLLLAEFSIYKIALLKFQPIRVITQNCLLAVAVLLVIMIWYRPSFHLVPIFLTTMLIMNFICLVLDKHGAGMVYILSSLITGIISLIVISCLKTAGSFTWMMLLITSCIVFVLLLILKASHVITEIRKRTTL